MMSIEVSIPPGHSKGQVEWPQSNPIGDPTSEFTTLSKSEIIDEDILPWFKKQQTHGRVLIFVVNFCKYISFVFTGLHSCFGQCQPRSSNAAADPIRGAWGLFSRRMGMFLTYSDCGPLWR